MKKIIYTCNTGSYDRIKVPGYIADGWETVLFTDVPVKQPGWQQTILIPQEHWHADPRRIARKIKLLSHVFHPDADITFWMDANMQINCDLNFIEEHFLAKHDLATFRHPCRSCIYGEGMTIKKLKYDLDAIVDAQMRRYRKEHYPAENGLICSNIMMRRHTPAVKALNEMWWYELDNGSRRDQLSFNYCAWKLNFKYRCIEKNHRKSRNFIYRPHGS